MNEFWNFLIENAAVVVGIFVGLFLLFIAKGQSGSYKAHLAEVTSLNEENRKISRENSVIAQESLAVLKQIKILLEDRKS